MISRYETAIAVKGDASSSQAWTVALRVSDNYSGGTDWADGLTGWF